MLTKEHVKIALTVVSGFALALLIVGTSPSFQSCIYEHQNHAGGGSLQEHVSGFLVYYKVGRGCGGEWLHKHGEAIIALFTIILGIATWLLWRATKRLVEGAEDTAQRQLRAYLCAVGCRMKKFEVGKEVVATVTIENTGQTPAYDTTVVTTIEFRSLPIKENLILERPTQLSRTTVGRDQKILPSAYGRRLTQEEYFAVLNGDAAIFVYGQVKYRTAFGREPTTDFRFFFDDVSLRAADGTLRVATEGNEAT
jgi:hypothetical protein